MADSSDLGPDEPSKVELNSEPYKLDEISESLGSATELDARDRVKFGAQILLGLAILLVLASVVYLGASESSEQAAQAIYEFVTTFSPPLAFLVIGYYFRGDNK